MATNSPYLICGRLVASNQPLQPSHTAVTPRARARVAPAGGRLNGGVRRQLRGTGARKRRIVTLTLLAIVLSSCGEDYGVADLSVALSRLPGVRVRSVAGNDADWPLGPTDYKVELTIGSTGHLVMCGVPGNKLDAPRNFRLAAVGRWNLDVFGPGDAGRVQYVAGCPYSVEVGPGSTLDLLLPVSLRSVEDVIYAYPVLEAAIASWPDCRDLKAPYDGNTVRYCKRPYEMP